MNKKIEKQIDIRRTIREIDTKIAYKKNILNKEIVKRDKLKAKVQTMCNHPINWALELPGYYDHSGDNDHGVPCRVCKLCGYHEKAAVDYNRQLQGDSQYKYYKLSGEINYKQKLDQGDFETYFKYTFGREFICKIVDNKVIVEEDKDN